MANVPTAISHLAMNVLTLADKLPNEQIAALERGLPSASLAQIAAMLNLPKQSIITALKLAQRTITLREKTRKPFTLEESERILRVLRLHRLARQVFTTNEAVAQWLIAPDRSLGMRSPLEMLATDVGAAKVDNLAQAMMHGVPI
jgi:putative toxin-antitoxin system antitoxin component (TIGR02293 family)